MLQLNIIKALSFKGYALDNVLFFFISFVLKLFNHAVCGFKLQIWKQFINLDHPLHEK